MFLIFILVKAAVLRVIENVGHSESSVEVAVASRYLRGGLPISGGVFHHSQCAQVQPTWAIFPLSFCVETGLRVANGGECSAVCSRICDTDN